MPAAVKLPLVTVPETDNDVNVPSEVRLEVTTLAANTVPVNELALELAVNPVNADPLPIK